MKHLKNKTYRKDKKFVKWNLKSVRAPSPFLRGDPPLGHIVNLSRLFRGIKTFETTKVRYEISAQSPHFTNFVDYVIPFQGTKSKLY